jgi:predicted chitinase
MRIEAGTLRHLWPRAPQDKIATIARISEREFNKHGITDWNDVVQLMANISTETGGGTIVRESGNYRAERIVEVFGEGRSSAKVTPQEATRLAHNGKALFERVYNDSQRSPKLTRELGNKLPGDGFKYRGGGDLQLTGRANYERIGRMTGHPEIIDNPDLLKDLEISFEVAVAEFAALGCIGLYKKGTTAVRRRINGGTNGLKDCQAWVHRWSEALPQVESPTIVPRGADTCSAENKPLTESTIIKGSIGGGLATAGGIASQIGTAAGTVTDTASTVHDTVTSTIEAGKVVHKAVKPFLGLMPEVWLGIGIACGVITLGYFIYIGVRRYLMHRRDGV